MRRPNIHSAQLRRQGVELRRSFQFTAPNPRNHRYDISTRRRYSIHRRRLSQHYSEAQLCSYPLITTRHYYRLGHQVHARLAP
jgi:hypothetical protein